VLRSTLKSVVHAVKESQDKGQLPQDAYLWGNIVRRMQQAGRATLREQAGKALHAVRARKTDGWRALLTDGRLALEDSLRLARREAEQLEAFRIFERLEGTIHAHRAQAVVMLKYLELEADKLVCSLPPDRRFELRQIARELRDAGLGQAQHTRGDQNCGQCVRQLVPDKKGGDCCSGMVFMAFDELDALFRVLLGESAPIIRSWSGDFTRCGFLINDRCSLTPGTRPVVCTAYYCTPYRTALQEAGRWEPLGELLNALQDARAQLGFKVKMSRRFGLGEVTHGADAHPVDFYWERLRTRGARHAASSADATKGTRLPRLRIMQ